MNESDSVCRDEQRRNAIRRMGSNGLDYLEVSHDRLKLFVYFIGQAPNPNHPPRVWLEGGRRVPASDIRILDVGICPKDDRGQDGHTRIALDRDRCMHVVLDRAGDSSTYRLCVESDANNPFDPRYTCLDFTFTAGCPSDLDCRPAQICPPPARAEPEISYLAKDYATFRQLILDRLALIMPEWRERHVPDLGMALVEMLAYVGDYLSYYQDAVATEAYLETARRRISVRRHARLVDYRLHEGCNARTWVCVEVNQDCKLNAENIFFVPPPRQGLRDLGVVFNESILDGVDMPTYVAFEPLMAGTPIPLFQDNNELRFYTWGDRECCLPRGATSATLHYSWGQRSRPNEATKAAWAGRQESLQTVPPVPKQDPQEHKHLKPGDVLIFQEVKGPRTGLPADADPAHRHAVRLTQVDYTSDRLCGVQVAEIAWGEEDALPFPLRISAIGAAPQCEYIEDISVAYGNVILVDQGRRIWESLPVPPGVIEDAGCEGEGQPREPTVQSARFNPHLSFGPLTHAAPLPPDRSGDNMTGAFVSAKALLEQDPHAALPWVRLQETTSVGTLTWLPQYDLLASGPEDRHFVTEVDSDGHAYLRFGDGELGRAPQGGVKLKATYRIGNGAAGNVGADTLVHLVCRSGMLACIRSVRNPLPAQGGTEPEPIHEAKLFAPFAFRKELQRAVTAADYANLAERGPETQRKVQRAAAALRWTGSWYEAQVAIDAKGGAEPGDALLRQVAGQLYAFRRIGHDLRVLRATTVPLVVRLKVCAKPHFLRGHVKAALLEAFSNRLLPDGRRGFFHPNALTFGDGIYISRLVAVARAAPGVERVSVTRLWRMDWADDPALENRILDEGILPLGPLEVARLDNDPAQPEYGRLEIDITGGR